MRGFKPHTCCCRQNLKKRKYSLTSLPSGRGLKKIDMNNNMDLLKEYASLAGKEDEKSEARKKRF